MGAIAKHGLAKVDAVAAEDESPALVLRIRAGDSDAFRLLFLRYYEPLCSLVATYVGLSAVAEEITQDVLMWVWEQRATWNVRDDVAHYLYGAARHRALNWLRRERVNERWSASAAVDLQIAGMGQGPANVEDTVVGQDFDRAVAEAVAKLPDRRRQAFTLRWQQRMSYHEIAQVMGISSKAVEKLLAHAFATLRANLKGLL